MGTPLFVALALAAAPSLEPIPVPFGHAGHVVSAPGEDPGSGWRRVAAEPAGCGQQQQYDLDELLTAALRAAEQLQTWLDKQPGLEQRLFAAKFKLADLYSPGHPATPAEQHACKAPPLADGYRLIWAAVPKLCPGVTAGPWGDYWWTSENGASAVVQLSAPRVAPKADAGTELPFACRPRFSVVLFDPKGTARLRWNAEYLGNLSVSLLAESCQQIDFSLDLPSLAFVPAQRWARGCKAQ